VSFGGEVAIIPPNEIDNLRRVVESGMSVEPHPFLKCGESVRIKSGPLSGVQGVLVRKRDLYRLILSVEMLGKSASVEIDAFLVEKVNSNRFDAPGIGPKADLKEFDTRC
jgi:transcription antitermination factor NusG